MTSRSPHPPGRPRRALVLGVGPSLVAVALILAMTLSPDPPWLFRVLAELLDPWVSGTVIARVLNVLLFVPLGIAIGLWRRPWWLLGAVAGSIAIELTQHQLDERTPDVLDVLTNTLGAALGYLAVRWRRQRTGISPRGDGAAPAPARRRRPRG